MPALPAGILRFTAKPARYGSAMGDTNELGDVPQVVSQIGKIRAQGTGILGMKLVGEGQFTNADDREASMKFVARAWRMRSPSARRVPRKSTKPWSSIDAR